MNETRLAFRQGLVWGILAAAIAPMMAGEWIVTIGLVCSAVMSALVFTFVWRI